MRIISAFGALVGWVGAGMLGGSLYSLIGLSGAAAGLLAYAVVTLLFCIAMGDDL